MIARFFGLGSVFGKTLRDSRWAVLLVGGLLGLLTLVTGYAIGDQFSTAADRAQIAAQMGALPAMFRGLLGEAVNIETLPGFLSWRVFGFMPVMLGLWSVAALAGTLAGEASKGTMEMLLSTPISRRSVAVQKFSAHLAGMLGIVAIITFLTWLCGEIFGTLPGDHVDIAAALSETGMVALLALLVGSISFALAPLLGRNLAAGIGGVYLFGSYVVNGYADIVPGFDVLRLGSMFYWTTHHRPLAGVYDWPPVILIAALVAAFAIAGVVLFVRRDLAHTISIGSRLPHRLRLPFASSLSLGSWSLRGPGWRSFGERLPGALGWGGLLGLYGFVIAISADQFTATLSSVPQIMEMIRQFYPGIDLESGGGILQIALFGFVALVSGIASAALVAGWASDERSQRLETVLSTPTPRASWFLRSGGAVLVALMSMSLVFGLLTGLGSLLSGDEALPVVAGCLVIGGYAAALAGIGIAVAGLGWPGLAAPAVAVVTLGMYLLDLIGGILRLPDWLLNASLARHLGQPMAGDFDWPGMAACAILAIGGVVLGAWRFARRDLG